MTAGGAGIPLQRVAAEDPTTLASPRAVPSNRSGGGRETGDDSSPAVLRTNSSTRQTRKLGICLVPLSPRNLVVDLDSWPEGCHSQTPVAVEKLHAPSPRWLSTLSFTSSRITSGRPCHVFADMPSSTML